jgi:hypothetical protein
VKKPHHPLCYCKMGPTLLYSHLEPKMFACFVHRRK